MKFFLSFLLILITIEEKIYEYYEVETKPKILRRVEPVYPEGVEGKEGYVILKVLVNKEGKISKTITLLSSNPIFKRLALKAIKAFEFNPGLVGGKPVPSWIEIPFRFRSDRKEAPLKRSSPVYPEKAEGEGEVYLLLHIGKNGEVKEATIFESSNPIFNKPALEAAKKFVFRKTNKGFWALLHLSFRK